ncbi:MAG: hypothetical protein OXI86_13880 [Candidatus Poribacteria bacterium]|nr:hypothetical protein [Candidatus Poribacteria bacterium]
MELAIGFRELFSYSGNIFLQDIVQSFTTIIFRLFDGFDFDD